jgi:beta-barrel assembly-enhancing protease
MKLLAAAVLGVTLIGVSEEIELGRQANAKITRELPQFRDAAITTYVRSIGRTLARSARGPKYPYSFSVADYREINAFALPGGPIWINRGVLHAATNESQLAGVLAHEIAHISQRHAARQVTNGAFANWGLGLLSALLGNTGGATTARTAAGLMANGIFLKFSRDDEREADRVGLQILTRAGWDRRGMAELFEVLQRAQKRDPVAVELFFSTHPPPAERIRQLRADAVGRSGGRRDSSAFRQARARSLKMPPPRQMEK